MENTNNNNSQFTRIFLDYHIGVYLNAGTPRLFVFL